MSEAVSIQYALGRHGWSNFRLNIGTASVAVGPFGYCTDAIGDLVRAALMIATSGVKATEGVSRHICFRPEADIFELRKFY